MQPCAPLSSGVTIAGIYFFYLQAADKDMYDWNVGRVDILFFIRMPVVMRVLRGVPLPYKLSLFL